MKFERVPQEISAVQLTEKNFYDMIDIIELKEFKSLSKSKIFWLLDGKNKYISFETIDGRYLTLRETDWLCETSNGRLFVSSHEDFCENYIIKGFDKNIIG